VASRALIQNPLVAAQAADLAKLPPSESERLRHACESNDAISVFVACRSF
jgi:hypothetical protein